MNPDDKLIHEKGKKRLEESLDIATYYKKIKQLEITIKTLFNDHNQYLIRQQKEFAIESGHSHGNSSDSDGK